MKIARTFFRPRTHALNRAPLAGRLDFVGAGGCLKIGTAWASLRLIHHHLQTTRASDCGLCRFPCCGELGGSGGERPEWFPMPKAPPRKRESALLAPSAGTAVPQFACRSHVFRTYSRSRHAPRPVRRPLVRYPPLPPLLPPPRHTDRHREAPPRRWGRRGRDGDRQCSRSASRSSARRRGPQRARRSPPRPARSRRGRRRSSDVALSLGASAAVARANPTQRRSHTARRLGGELRVIGVGSRLASASCAWKPSETPDHREARDSRSPWGASARQSTPSPLLLRRRRLGRCCSEERERGVSAVGRRRSSGVVGQTR